MTRFEREARSGAQLVSAHAVRVTDFDFDAVLGTLQYMSPEQLRGESVDRRTDIWAMAVIAFECLTATNPFPLVSSPDPTVSICDKPLPKPSEFGPVPDGFDAWFWRGTSRDTSERFQSVREAIDELKRVLVVDDAPGHDLETPRVDAPPKAPHRRGLAVAVVGLVSTGLIGCSLGRLVGRAEGQDTLTLSPDEAEPKSLPPPRRRARQAPRSKPSGAFPSEISRSSRNGRWTLRFARQALLRRRPPPRSRDLRHPHPSLSQRFRAARARRPSPKSRF